MEGGVFHYEGAGFAAAMPGSFCCEEGLRCICM